MQSIVAVVAAWALLSMGFYSPWFPMATLGALQKASGGWVSATLVGSATVGVVILLLVLTLGRQRLRDLGWERRKLVPAIAVTVLLWAAMQAATVLAAQASGSPLQWHPSWAAGAGIALGPLLAQLLGTALFEETVFRAWLWPQIAARMPGADTRWLAPTLGLVVSQAIFALLHVPARLYAGAGTPELAGMLLMLFVVGIVFALAYWATGNLFIAVGAHALGNAPTLLFERQGPEPTLIMLGGLLVVMLVGWVWCRRGRTAGACGQ